MDSDFSSNSISGIAYESSNIVPNRHNVHIERCVFTNNNITMDTNDEERYAVSLKLQNSDFVIGNCLFQDNIGMGGIVVDFQEPSDFDGQVGHILNCEFEGNVNGSDVVNLSSSASSPAVYPYVKIEGSSFVRNSPLDSFSIISIKGLYIDIVSNIMYNNDGGNVLYLDQSNIPFLTQKCTDNAIIYNIGQDINEKHTIELQSNGMEFHNNIIQNPANEFEINAISGDQAYSSEENIINATSNWWGTGSAYQIMNRIRDSDEVIGFADVIFEPFLTTQPSDIQNSKYVVYVRVELCLLSYLCICLYA